MRIEPKTFFANERTFLTWMHMAVTIGTIAAALLGFSGSAQRTDKPSYEVRHAIINSQHLAATALSKLMGLHGVLIMALSTHVSIVRAHHTHATHLTDHMTPKVEALKC